MSAPPSGAGSVVVKLWGSFKHIQMSSAKELQVDSDWSFFLNEAATGCLKQN